MMAKPMKYLELHYLMIQFLINHIIRLMVDMEGFTILVISRCLGWGHEWGHEFLISEINLILTVLIQRWTWSTKSCLPWEKLLFQCLKPICSVRTRQSWAKNFMSWSTSRYNVESLFCDNPRNSSAFIG